MKKSAKRISEGFESASYTTPEFKGFCRTFSDEFKKLAEGLCDVRWSNGRMYFRTAKDYKDYHGGYNINTNINDIDEELARYIK